MGPYQEARAGVLYRQEILWDDVRVEGATLAGGGFETDGRAAAWHGAGAVIAQAADVPAVEGTHYARTWHNQTLSAHDDRSPAAGRSRSASSARAVRPEGFVEMKRIAGRSTPARSRRPTVPPRCEPGQRPRSPARARTGASTTRRTTCASSRPRASTTSASPSAGTTTPAPAPSSASGPRSSPGPTSWSTPALRQGLAVIDQHPPLR